MNNSCEEIKDKIADYVLGIMDEDEVTKIGKHIEQCAGCKELLECLQKEREVLLQLGENLDSKMNEREESVIAALEKISNEQSTKTTFFYSKVFRYAAAAVIAIALLIPLSYGANNLIKRLVAGSVQYDDYKGDFSLDKDIRVELQVGNKENQTIVSASNIRFFVENGELRGTLRFYANNLPEFRWITQVQLLDMNGNKLVVTEHINKNSGIENLPLSDESFIHSIHFTLGKAKDVSNADKFIVGIKEVSGSKEITYDSWSQSDVLPILQGRVTNHKGEPIYGAKVQIREKRKPRQSGISAPDVITDENGFYSFDAINWEYSVNILVYLPYNSGQGYRHYFKGLNQTFEGSQVVDFEIEEFPKGYAVVFGKMETPEGEPIKEFRVDIRSHVDWNNRTDQYTYQFGYKRPFITKDGRYEIDNLPAGTYDVILFPAKQEIMTEEDYINRKEYSFEIQSGQRFELGSDNVRGNIYYGRVLFEDGTPAVPELSEYTTQIVSWAQDSTIGGTEATVDNDGYFQIQIKDESLERYKSGESWLVVGIAKLNSMHNNISDERFLFSKLSPVKENAGIMYIERPTLSSGRVFYGDKPAVCEVTPWGSSSISVGLRYSRRGAAKLYVEKNGSVDKDGYFRILLTQSQIDMIKSGDYSIDISHPSYSDNRTNYLIQFPFELLSQDKENVKGYDILTDNRVKSENLSEVLNSINNLKVFYTALDSYAQENNRNYPEIMGFAEIQTEDLQWLVQNVVYFPAMKSLDDSESAKTVIAYDKTLLEKYDATLVLFMDGHIQYCWPRELEILGIKKPEATIVP